jgi:hypothetical protein
MSQIYYSRWKGRIAGPYTATQIQEELRAKRLSRFHEISTDQRDWRPLAELPELLPKPPPAPVVVAPVITPADVRPSSRRPITPREELNDEKGDSTTNLSREVRRDGDIDTRKRHGRTPNPEDGDDERTLPRVRRAPANNNEAADRDNAWTPPGQGAFCTSCGKPIMLGAVICPRCGVPTDRRATAAQVMNPESQAGATGMPLKIPNHLVQSILVTLFCCLPFGIIAIVYASQVNAKIQTGDIQGAVDASQKANMWSWVSFGGGIVVGVIYFVGSLLDVFSKL